MRDVVSVTEAAAILAVTRQWVLRLIERGKLDATKVGNTWTITRQSVEAYDQGRTRSKKA